MYPNEREKQRKVKYKSYPALRKISGQTNVIPDNFYKSLSGLIDAVSYTHLDVYKRQKFFRACLIINVTDRAVNVRADFCLRGGSYRCV